MIDGLFRTYRPELHDMRGPGSKWHAKHGVRIGQTVFVDGGCRGAIAAPARRTIKLQDRRAKWKRASPMLQILTLVLAMLVNPATAARTETSYCGRYLAAARLRWAPTLTNPLIGFSCASEPARLEQVVTGAPGPPDMVSKRRPTGALSPEAAGIHRAQANICLDLAAKSRTVLGHCVSY